MTEIYDHGVEQVSDALSRAEENLKQHLELHRSATTFAAWQRVQHWHRLANAHRHHLHWWYLESLRDSVCTCGLLAALPRPAAHLVAGHRDPRTWEPTSLLVIHSLTTGSPSPSPASRPLVSARYQATCQTCGYISNRLSLTDAARARATHACTPPQEETSHD